MCKVRFAEMEESMNRKNIGQNLRTLRRQCGMTQAQLAEKIGVSTDHVSHAEIGFGSISLPLLLEICKLLDVTPNDILAGEYTPDYVDEKVMEERALYGKDIVFEDVNPDDRMLLSYLHQFMLRRKRTPQSESGVDEIDEINEDGEE